MGETLLHFAGRVWTLGDLVLATTVLAILALAAALLSARGRARRAGEMEEGLAAIARAQAEMTGRMQTMAEVFGTRQAELSRTVGERLDGFGHRLGQNLDTQARATHDTLNRLNERLAVIDTAQRNITELSKEVVSLQQILADKQTRGAFGQGLMEAIVRDGLPANAYTFQPTLSNGRRPDCLISLPGGAGGLVVDAKFPLEAFTRFREAADEDARKVAGQGLRTDMAKHISDIRERYFVPGETQDIAFLFVPSESVYADLHEHFEDVVQKGRRARVIVVGPSMLMLAISVMQSILRDQRMREQAHVLHREVTMLSDDVRRLGERVGKLQTHFGQAGEDIRQILVSTEKIAKRGARIDDIDFGEDGQERRLPLAGE